MIINPIIPIWVMTIISIFAIFLVYNKQSKNFIKKNEITDRQRILSKKYKNNLYIKISIIVLLFIINLRFMIPNGENTEMTSDLSVLFIIDTSVSMRALDYNGNKERFEGVVNDCCYIVDELSGSKFSIITFGDKAKQVIPFTTDSDMVQAELKAIKLEDDLYAKGTSINSVLNIFESTLQKEIKRKDENSKFVVFFISDGEITKENETLQSFSSVSKYISNGAVMGYGTEKRWKNDNESL